MKYSFVKTLTLSILCLVSSVLRAEDVAQHGNSLSMQLTLTSTTTPMTLSLPQKEWTAIFYLAADNSLNDAAFLNLNQMMAVGSNEYLNIVVYLAVTDPVQGKVGLKLFVEPGKITVLGIEPLADSGSPDTFANFVIWALQEYPSNHVAIGLWDHGSGDLSPIRQYSRVGICFDDTYGTYMNDQGIISAFDRILAARNNAKIDIVLFDACLMAGSATAWLMSPYAQYMVASEETVAGDGFPYDKWLVPFAQGVTDCKVLTGTMLTSFNDYYSPLTQDYTASALQPSAIVDLSKNIDALAGLLNYALDQQIDLSVNDMIAAARDPKICLQFDEPSYVDLYSLYTNLLAGVPAITLADETKTAAVQKTLQAVLEDGIKLLNKLVVAKVNGTDFNGAGGLSIFFPEFLSDNPVYDSYLGTEFGKQSLWPLFLQTYGVLL